jgi:hypothetical protein
MSPRLQQVLTEIAQLTPEERSQLIEQIQQMQSFETPPKKSWQDLEGIASNLLKCGSINFGMSGMSAIDRSEDNNKCDSSKPLMV